MSTLKTATVTLTNGEGITVREPVTLEAGARLGVQCMHDGGRSVSRTFGKMLREAASELAGATDESATVKAEAMEAKARANAAEREAKQAKREAAKLGAKLTKRDLAAAAAKAEELGKPAAKRAKRSAKPRKPAAKRANAPTS